MTDTLVKNIIRPQPGFQMKFLSSPADIAIGGGAAGVGKTFAELTDPIRYLSIPGFGGTIFRRTSTQISTEGGLWDASQKLYGLIEGAQGYESRYRWKFGNGNKINFAHLQHEKDKYSYQGSEIPYIGFDELTHFTQTMFFFMLSRSRTTCGVRPYVRATCNPDPDSWVAELIKWWINPTTGFPIAERNGVIRYFFRKGDDFVWGSSVKEVYEKCSSIIDPIIQNSEGKVKVKHLIKSFTFISGSIYDNKKLLGADPGYIANLLNQDEETKSRLLDGNWNIHLSEDEIFDYYAFKDAFESQHMAQRGQKYLTADIALEGSDKFVIVVWDGWMIEKIYVIPKSDGKQVVDKIKEIQKRYRIPNRHVAYDNDGVGGFVGGYIKGAIPFINKSKALQNENYEHLKAQCAYRMGKRVNENQITFGPEVATAMYDTKKTIRQQFMYERRAFKKYKTEYNGPLRLLPKQEMKIILNGASPDLMDALIMREVFEMKSSYRPRMVGG